MAIKTSKLSAGYRGKSIIHQVSMKIPKGSFCTIIGTNGCGKSTLLKALSRNLVPIKGSIEIEGKNILDYNSKVLARKLAYLSQSPYIPSQFSAADLVSCGRFPHSKWMSILSPYDHKIIDWAMKLTETSDFAHRELEHLSGGERQRVWIAMALAQEAEILLLDEPTTHLDMAHQFQTLEFLQHLNREMGQTILMAIHDINHAARFSDHIFVFKNGYLLTQGPPELTITKEVIKEAFSVNVKIIQDYENNCLNIIPLRGIKKACLFS
ncbi:MAG: ABC transporter ATP-binding protein [Spirochaetales bacterium]|nr:ABC transporter ATP-binding protein [Spirochaetales bacterium]